MDTFSWQSLQLSYVNPIASLNPLHPYVSSVTGHLFAWMWSTIKGKKSQREKLGWISKTLRTIWSKTMNDNHHNMRNVSRQIILFLWQTLLFCWNDFKKIARDESCEGGDKSFLWDPLGGGWIWTKRRRWGTFSQEMMGWPKSFHRIRLQIDL